MPPNMFSVGGGRPAPPCDVARCRTFVHLYSVIQNSMGLRGGELQTNVKKQKSCKSHQKLPKSRRNRGCHEAAIERISLKFVTFHFSKIENHDFQFLKGFYKGKIPLYRNEVHPSALHRLGHRPPACRAKYVNDC